MSSVPDQPRLLIAVAFCLLGFLAVIFTYRGIGYSWDEALYRKPGIAAVEWWARAVNGDASCLSASEIGRHWGVALDSIDPMHPEIAPVPKLLTGVGGLTRDAFSLDPLTAIRWPFAAIFGMTLSLIYCWGTREFGHWGGAAAALSYLLLPRAFGHAHIAASETLAAFCAVGTAYCFVRACDKPRMSLLCALLFGFAIATKVTLWILPAILLFWGQVFRRPRYATAMFSLLALAPIIAAGLWPWLWHDGIRRLFSYALFYLQHQQTAVLYLGEKWGYVHGPPAPWHYPWVILGVATPEWFLVLAAVGIMASLLGPGRSGAKVLMIVLALIWPAISSLPNSPKYDGERLFFPAFAFLALLAGGGFAALHKLAAKGRRLSYGIGAGGLLLLAAYGCVDLVLSHPSELNYFNVAVGRPRGAYDRGFETSYWGDALNGNACAYLTRVMKPGEKVLVLSMNGECFGDLQEWGKLPAGVDFGAPGLPADWIIMQIRQGFMGRLENELLRSGKPQQVFSAQGVPRMMLFRGDAVGAPASASSPGAGKTSPALQPSGSDLPTSASLPESSSTSSTASAANFGARRHDAALAARGARRVGNWHQSEHEVVDVDFQGSAGLRSLRIGALAPGALRAQPKRRQAAALQNGACSDSCVMRSATLASSGLIS